MIQYQQPAWAPARPRHLAQAPAEPPAAPPAPAPKLLNMSSEPVQTFLVTQGVALAYAITAGIFYGKKAEFIDRILLGVGGLSFGAASWASYRMAATNSPNTPTQITGGVMGTLDALTAIGAFFGAFRPKPVRTGVLEAAARGLPI